MIFRFLADLTVLLHLAFVLFVVLGGLAVLWRRKVLWLHIPAVLWGALIEFYGWICPLTPLENWLRIKGDEPAYSGGFIVHYILPVLYPEGLTPGAQKILGTLVIAINAAIYLWIIARRIRQAGKK